MKKVEKKKPMGGRTVPSVKLLNHKQRGESLIEFHAGGSDNWLGLLGKSLIF